MKSGGIGREKRGRRWLPREMQVRNELRNGSRDRGVDSVVMGTLTGGTGGNGDKDSKATKAKKK